MEDTNMNNAHRYLKLIALFVFVFLAAIAASCGGGSDYTAPAPTPTPTPAPTTTSFSATLFGAQEVANVSTPAVGFGSVTLIEDAATSTNTCWQRRVECACCNDAHWRTSRQFESRGNVFQRAYPNQHRW